MHRGLACILGLAVIGAAWWLAGHPGWQKEPRLKSTKLESTEANRPALYRWHDENGVTQITQTPPKGRKYTVVSIREDQNIIESAATAPEPPQ
jgi:Domain of unknown function (DUF4124)